MKKARVILATILLLAATAGVFAFKARANTYYYVVGTVYSPTVVSFTCVEGSSGCTFVINGSLYQLYLWVNGVYVPLRRI